MPAFASGDCASSAGTVSLTCTKTNGVAFTFFATLGNLSGDVATGGSGTTTIQPGVVTNGKLAPSANLTIRSNISGGSASPSDNTLSAILDAVIGNTRGSILYRGSAGWAGAPPGAAGYVWTSNGSGSDPNYQPSSATSAVGFRNRIINGGMDIDQRNAGASQTITAGAALAYTVDRFYGYSTGANVTGQQVANTGNSSSPSRYAYQFTGAASVTGIGFCQRISSAHSFDLAGNSVVVSANLDDSLLTSVGWSLSYANSTDAFGSLASPTVTAIQSGTFTVTATSARYSTPAISIPSAATTGLQICFTVGAQTSGTLHIGNVQAEVGSTATAFERRPYSVEFYLAEQRYYKPNIQFSAQGYGTASGANVYTTWELPAPMSSSPTIVASWGGLVTANGGPITVLSDNRTVNSYITSTAAGQFAGGLQIISLSAEL